MALELATKFFLGYLVGFTPPSPAGEGGAPITDAARPWLLPIVVGLGGLISGIIVFRFAPEAEGHGTDAAIAAFHHGPRSVRSRIPFIKLVSSAITIGSGGSGGREGPTAQIGAGFGSYLSRLLDLDARDARIAVASGMAAGIGAIFRAPLGGAVLGAEILYREDVESEALVPSFVASVVAFSIFGTIIGFSPIFGEVGGAGFEDPRQLFYYALIGLAAGVVGRLYIRNFYGLTARFHAVAAPGSSVRRSVGSSSAASGSCCRACSGPATAWCRQGWTGRPSWRSRCGSSLSCRSPRSWRHRCRSDRAGPVASSDRGWSSADCSERASGVCSSRSRRASRLDPAPFVIVGMMALFGSVAHAPLAVMLMVAEMTDNLAMLAPAMIAVGLATLIVGDRTMYRSQLRTEPNSPAHRFRFAMPLMSAILVGDAARVPKLVFEGEDRVARRPRSAGRAATSPVRRWSIAAGYSEGRQSGTLDAADPKARLRDVADTSFRSLLVTGSTMHSGALADHHADWAPSSSDGRLVGIVSARDVMARVPQGASTGTSGRSGDWPAAACCSRPTWRDVAAGRGVGSGAAWPAEVVLVAIERTGALIVPRGDVVLQAGDHVSLFAAPASELRARELLGQAGRGHGHRGSLVPSELLASRTASWSHSTRNASWPLVERISR